MVVTDVNVFVCLCRAHSQLVLPGVSGMSKGGGGEAQGARAPHNSQISSLVSTVFTDN